MKDRIVSWYIRKILVPKIEEIDKPGFVMENLARARLMNIVLRQVFLPEKILIDLEEKMEPGPRMEGPRRQVVRGRETQHHGILP